MAWLLRTRDQPAGDGRGCLGREREGRWRREGGSRVLGKEVSDVGGGDGLVAGDDFKSRAGRFLWTGVFRKGKLAFEEAVDGLADGNVFLARQGFGEAVVFFLEVDG